MTWTVRKGLLQPLRDLRGKSGSAFLPCKQEVSARGKDRNKIAHRGPDIFTPGMEEHFLSSNFPRIMLEMKLAI